MHTLQRPIWSLIRRLICLSVGLCLAAGALVFMLQVEVTRSPSAAIAVRLLVVMAAGMIVGAATGRAAYAVLGAAIGMIAGDVMYVRLVSVHGVHTGGVEPPRLVRMRTERAPSGA